MTDTIRKAVELADGFFLKNKIAIMELHLNEISDVVAFSPDETFPKWILDALAAQLVRQVDALDTNADPEFIKPVLLHIFSGSTAIDDCREFPPTHKEWDGPDRTMNTIRAIVDSGVLE